LDTAYGINLVSVAMVGYTLIQMQTNPQNNINLNNLQNKIKEHTTDLILTNPSTLNLFEENITEITNIFHSTNTLLYYDKANLNTVYDISQPSDIGFDIVHYNLHKTFSQPHGD